MISSKLFSYRDKGHLPQAKARDRASVSFLLLALCSMLYLLTSCAPKRIEMPSYEGIDVKDMLSEKGNVKSLSSTFSIEFEKDGSMIHGDAVLKLSPGTVDLQVYSFGLLVAEVSSIDDVTTSVPPIDKNRLSMLVDGLKNSFLWWSIKNPDIGDDGNTYQISNSWKRLFIDKKTMMPIKQLIDLENGRELKIFYEDPALINGVWFPSKMRVELSRYSVSLKIKSLIINPL